MGNVSVGLALWFGVLTCFVSVLFSFQLAFWDWRGDRVKPPSETEEESIRFRDVLSFPYTIWMLIGVCVFFYISVFVWLQNAVYVPTQL
jgi:hypothetical protein